MQCTDEGTGRSGSHRGLCELCPHLCCEFLLRALLYPPCTNTAFPPGVSYEQLAKTLWTCGCPRAEQPQHLAQLLQGQPRTLGCRTPWERIEAGSWRLHPACGMPRAAAAAPCPGTHSSSPVRALPEHQGSLLNTHPNQEGAAWPSTVCCQK